MKSLHFFSKTLWLCMLAVWSGLTAVNAQTLTDGVTKQNGVLVFQSQADFEAKLLQLRNSAETYDYSLLPDEQPTTQFTDPMPSLGSFEQALGFSSLRYAAEQKVFTDATRGMDTDIDDELFGVDEILATLLSYDRMIMIGGTLYYIESEAFNFQFNNASLNIINLIRSGKSPLDIPGVILNKGDLADGTCSADFYPNGFGTSLSGSFIYSGTPGANDITSYLWYFGDGTTSTSQNPNKTYSAVGTYTVCLQIRTKDGCISDICKDITISNNNQCTPFFIWNETGTPGGMSFKDVTSLIGGQTITSRTWDFGDGSPTSNQQNPTHTFPCDKRYFVTLTITTSTGCTNSITLPVEIDSYNCCERWAKVEGWRYYDWSGDKYRFHYKAKHVNLPFIRYVHTAMRHSKKGFLGAWWWKKANLAIALRGNVYKADERGCFCQTPYNINSDKANNTFWLIMDKNVGNEFLTPFKAKKTDPWNCTFRVTNRNITEYHVLNVSCD